MDLCESAPEGRHVNRHPAGLQHCAPARSPRLLLAGRSSDYFAPMEGGPCGGSFREVINSFPAIYSLLGARDATLLIGANGLASWKDRQVHSIAKAFDEFILALPEDRGGIEWVGGVAVPPARKSSAQSGLAARRVAASRARSASQTRSSVFCSGVDRVRYPPDGR